MLGDRMLGEGLEEEGQHGGPRAPVAERDVPEARGGEPRHQDDGADADPHCRQDRVGARVGVKRRHHDGLPI